MTSYTVDAGFGNLMVQWHTNCQDISLHSFWDKKDAEETTQTDDMLTFHRIDGQESLYYLVNCKAYATIGGFESMCGAIYMGKPAMMVSVHVEQECNAHKATLEGAEIKSDSLSTDQFTAFSQQYMEKTELHTQENSAKIMIVVRLKAAAGQYNSTVANKGYSLTSFGRKSLVKGLLHNFAFKNY